MRKMIAKRRPSYRFFEPVSIIVEWKNFYLRQHIAYGENYWLCKSKGSGKVSHCWFNKVKSCYNAVISRITWEYAKILAFLNSANLFIYCNLKINISAPLYECQIYLLTNSFPFTVALNYQHKFFIICLHLRNFPCIYQLPYKLFARYKRNCMWWL